MTHCAVSSPNVGTGHQGVRPEKNSENTVGV